MYTVYSEGIAIAQNGRSFLDLSRSCLVCGRSISSSCFGRRFCSRHQPRHKVRTLNHIIGNTAVSTERGPQSRSSQFRIEDFLSLLPDTCEGAILRELITSKPPVVPQHQLVERPPLLRDFKPETIRKTVARLIAEGLIENWGQSKFGDVLVFSSLASWRYRRELQIDETSAAICRLTLWQGSVPKKLPDDLAQAFRHLRWTVDCFICRQDESPQSKAWTIEHAAHVCRVPVETIERWIERGDLEPATTTGQFLVSYESLKRLRGARRRKLDQAFDRLLDDPRANPYFNAHDQRHDYSGSHKDEAVRRQGEHFDGRDEGIAAMSMSPVSIAIAAESHGGHSEMFATQLIGTTRPGWSTDLEPLGERGCRTIPVTCNVCGYGLQPEGEDPRSYGRLEACLGCLRSGMDRPAQQEEEAPKRQVQCPEPQLCGGLGKPRLEACHA